jgi:hypothetical protein
VCLNEDCGIARSSPTPQTTMNTDQTHDSNEFQLGKNANSKESRSIAAIFNKFLGSLLKHIHVSENDRGLLGSGHVDFPGVIAALRKIDYKGFLMIEGIGSLPNQTRTGCINRFGLK